MLRGERGGAAVVAGRSEPRGRSGQLVDERDDDDSTPIRLGRGRGSGWRRPAIGAWDIAALTDFWSSGRSRSRAAHAARARRPVALRCRAVPRSRSATVSIAALWRHRLADARHRRRPLFGCTVAFAVPGGPISPSRADRRPTRSSRLGARAPDR
jgi:hypothetical protein